MDVSVGVDCDRWQRLLTRIDRGQRRRALARARGRKEGRKVVGGRQPEIAHDLAPGRTPGR